MDAEHGLPFRAFAPALFALDCFSGVGERGVLVGEL